MSTASERLGLIAAGNFIVDQVKIIDGYPEQDTLASITSEKSSNGGGPYNVLKDLAKMGANFPLEAVGLVGQDAHGDWIVRDCQEAGLGSEGMQRSETLPTSYTDAMTVEATGRRTFFHQRGANAQFGLTEVRQAMELLQVAEGKGRLFYLGYLMLLDKLDVLDGSGKTEALVILELAKKHGLETIVDLVSAEHEQYKNIVNAALGAIDHLILNEWEAEKSVGFSVVKKDGTWDLEAVQKAAHVFYQGGLKKRVVFHSVHGAVAVTVEGELVQQASLCLPEDWIVGATGAGDAFAAGYILGVHEGWDLQESLKMAVCSAAMSLKDASPSEGLVDWKECLSLSERYLK